MIAAAGVPGDQALFLHQRIQGLADCGMFLNSLINSFIFLIIQDCVHLDLQSLQLHAIMVSSISQYTLLQFQYSGVLYQHLRTKSWLLAAPSQTYSRWRPDRHP